MANGIDVGIGADARDFDRAVRSDMVQPLEDAQKALEDYVGTGTDAGARLERSFGDQQRATVDLKGDIDRLNTSIRDGSQRSTAAASNSTHAFRQQATHDFDEVKDSARQNAIETAASFTGGFDQALGGLQGLLSEVGIAFGPAGIIAGLVAASGIGLITQQLDDGTTAAETQRQAVADLATQYVEAGGAGKRSFDDVKTAIEAMASSDGSDVAITLQQAWEKSKVAGADYQQVVQAIASASPSQIGAARRDVERLRQAHDDAASAARNDGTDTYSAAIKGAKGANELEQALDKAAGTAKKAQEASQLASRAGLSNWQRQADLIHQVEGAYDDAAGAADQFIDKAGEFKAAKYIHEVDKVREALRKYKDDIADSDLSAAAQHFLEQQGAQTAAAMVAGYKKASPAQQAQLQEIWTTAGNENATDYGDAIGGKLKGITVPAPKIAAPFVPAPKTEALDAFLRQPKVYRMVIEGVTRTGQRVF